jgi:hypothetical protein
MWNIISEDKTFVSLTPWNYVKGVELKLRALQVSNQLHFPVLLTTLKFPFISI